MYFVRTPYIIKKIFPEIIWDLPNAENKIYLTFDDGPHPEITPWILEHLKRYDAKATFFCLGKNAEKYPEIVKQILQDGHTIGNHGYAHLNGWKTENDMYVKDFEKGKKILKQVQDDYVQVQDSKKISRFTLNDDNKSQNEQLLFRPAYGKIKKSQISFLKSEISNLNSEILILNWSLMPGDFDTDISSEKCYSNLTNNIKVGDIVVLHDNEKSWKHLEYCLPKWLENLKKYNLVSIQL